MIYTAQRRRFRFSLRTLFAVVTVAAVLISIAVTYPKQLFAVAAYIGLALTLLFTAVSIIAVPGAIAFIVGRLVERIFGQRPN
jgi:hypothetical protein